MHRRRGDRDASASLIMPTCAPRWSTIVFFLGIVFLVLVDLAGWIRQCRLQLEC